MKSCPAITILVQSMLSKSDHHARFEMKICPGAPHAFFNNTNKSTYKEGLAKNAWERVLRVFARTLL